MKKLLISLLVAGVLVGAVFGAAASLIVGGVDDLGSGTFVVVSPDGGSTAVTDLIWTIDPANITLVSGAVVTITGNVDDEGNVCDVGLRVFDGTDKFDGVLTAPPIPATGIGGSVSTAEYDLTGTTLEAAEIASGGVTITLACDD